MGHKSFREGMAVEDCVTRLACLDVILTMTKNTFTSFLI